MKLGNNLRRCRFEMDEITQEALAKEVGVTRQTIISIEKNRYVPSALLALKLAMFFGRKFEDIFYLTEDED
ncbi:MAG: helix-turn-helix domain-containing protein [Candidatus Latescibacteria bacterium]|nr:helix-turn-helix domain-containing protein [bacterium]MBD3425062.1 helix-turn-helix domain-containing protein [Candidatus Latescibacterota bacterium]